MTSIPTEQVDVDTDRYAEWLTGVGSTFQEQETVETLAARVAQLEAFVTELRAAMYAKLNFDVNIVLPQINELRAEIARKSDRRVRKS